MLTRVSFKKVVLGCLAFYFLVTCYTGFKLVQKKMEKTERIHPEHKTDNHDNLVLRPPVRDDPDWNPWGQEFENEGPPKKVPIFEKPEMVWPQTPGVSDEDTEPGPGDFVVEIWGKAAIGLYLWEHILEGQLESKMAGIWSYGTKRAFNIIFRFRTGPGVMPAKVPQDVQHLVMVLNGREPSKIEFATMWLDYLVNLPNLKNVAIVLLGNEKCDNHWLHPYLQKNGGIVQFVFLVYDSAEIDDHNFYQWPLGVATYRQFPAVKASDITADTDREYLCNFLGTVYKNSSRETLLKIIKDHDLQDSCYIKPRIQWLPQESNSSREQYIRSLAQSDLTLNPVGQNTECYRIYEAMSFGSVPVVENVMTPGYCGNSSLSHNAPLRLLKEYHAPILYVSNWNELPEIIKREHVMDVEEVINRRSLVIRWYDNFKVQMRDRFVSILQKRFFGQTR